MTAQAHPDEWLSQDAIKARHFPSGIPELWCPPLTHYTADGDIDRARITAHLRFMATWVKGFLVPGTTGDGWELSPDEVRELIEIVLQAIQGLECQLLYGALHPDAGQAQQIISEALMMLQQRRPASTVAEALVGNQVCGFAICPPRGPDVTQGQMEGALSSILAMRVPLALYQLPQVTQNEMSPELVAGLAKRFPNFMLFKDTSGLDRVAMSGLDLKSVFLVRGMEGNYAGSLKLGGGSYDGFLLSTANSFAEPLHQIRQLLAAGRRAEAEGLSSRLSSVVDELFRIADSVTAGNKFTNANKLADHFYAHGPRAADLTPPRLHSGPWLKAEMVRAAGAALERHGFMPRKGYIE